MDKANQQKEKSTGKAHESVTHLCSWEFHENTKLKVIIYIIYNIIYICVCVYAYRGPCIDYCSPVLASSVSVSSYEFLLGDLDLVLLVFSIPSGSFILLASSSAGVPEL